jgi:peptidoglycan/xylan/chitin deacetylase (PgdA/CDA1 family)
MAPAILARVMPLFRREGENWTWQPLARSIIDRYGQQRAVLSAITANLGSFSWSGSLVPYFERQIQPLEQLRIHHIPEVRRWAGEQLRYLRQQIGWENARDNEHELGLF